MVTPLSILIVEDEPLIAMLLEDYIESLGHKVAGTAETVADAVARVAQGDFDCAILDANLRGGEVAWPVADALAARRIPFLFATGGQLEGVPSAHADVPLLAKPFTLADVEAALAGLALR